MNVSPITTTTTSPPQELKDAKHQPQPPAVQQVDATHHLARMAQQDILRMKDIEDQHRHTQEKTSGKKGKTSSDQEPTLPQTAREARHDLRYLVRDYEKSLRKELNSQHFDGKEERRQARMDAKQDQHLLMASRNLLFKMIPFADDAALSQAMSLLTDSKPSNVDAGLSTLQQARDMLWNPEMDKAIELGKSLMSELKQSSDWSAFNDWSRYERAAWRLANAAQRFE